jgi:transcriptional regulator with XRE-family HTH domain
MFLNNTKRGEIMSKHDVKNIGNRIRELRERQGWTQEDLVEKLKAYERVERSTLAKWETGRQDFKTKHIIALAEIFGVTSDYLLGISATPSTDLNIKSICDYTGLDEETVDFLHHEPDSAPLEIINQLLKSYEFWDILDELQRIQFLSSMIIDECHEITDERFDTLKECIQFLDSYYDDKHKSKKGLKQLMERKKELKLSQFGCDNSFKDIIKAFVDGRKLTPFYPLNPKEENEQFDNE